MAGSAGSWGAAVRAAAGIGGVAAGIELGALGVGGAIPLGAGAWIGLAALVVALHLSVAASTGAAAAAILGGRRGSARVGAAAWAASVPGAVALVGPGIARLLDEGQGVAAAVLGAVAIGLTGAAGVGAALWARRALGESDAPPPRAPVAALGLGVALLGAAAGGAAQRDGTAGPGPDGPVVVLVTVAGLGGSDLPPRLAALTAGGVRFTQAVSPVPHPRAAEATALVGLHPLRHRVLGPADRLSRGYTTAFEALAERGLPAAAFVSGAAVGAGSGLEQGFGRFDDLAGSGVRALLPRTAVGRALPLAAPHRAAPATADRFAAWAAGRRGAWAAWIQLDATDGPDALDRAADTIAAAVAPARAEGRLILAVAGAYGAAGPGPGGILADRAVLVPLALVLPGVEPRTVDAQVRLMDVAPTLVAVAGGELAQSEGVTLGMYARGMTAPLSCSLAGLDAAGTWWLGVRSNGTKVRFSADGRTLVHALDRDPDEAVDRRAEEPGVVEQARAALSSERAALAERCGAPCASWGQR